jgi:hypothetical protein
LGVRVDFELTRKTREKAGGAMTTHRFDLNE